MEAVAAGRFPLLLPKVIGDSVVPLLELSFGVL